VDSISVVDKFHYLGAVLENTGGWSIQKTSTNVKAYQVLAAVTPNRKVYTLESVYGMVWNGV
jgi:hypothetical protein